MVDHAGESEREAGREWVVWRGVRWGVGGVRLFWLAAESLKVIVKNMQTHTQSHRPDKGRLNEVRADQTK